MKTTALTLALLLLACCAAGARAEDVVTLDDGTVMKGKYLKEENGHIMLQQPEGEVVVIDKTRVKRMEIAKPPMVADGMKPPAAESEKTPPAAGNANANASAKPEIGKRDNQSKMLNPEWAKPRMIEMEDLGAPELARRKAALDRARHAKDEYMMVMLAMLNPKLKTAEYTRVGILRALLELAPLTDEAAKTLAFSAVQDPYPEARREACRTMRYLADDRAIRELVRYAMVENNNAIKQAAANALHEIDDNRIYAALVSAIPLPQVNGNYGEPTGLDQPKYTVPGGPGRLNIPLFLPSQEVSGFAGDIGGPITDFLKSLARKDLGNLPYGWAIWYREKVGEIGKDERDAYRERRSLRDRSNAPIAP
jgi:hypothetical protein